MHMRSDTTMIRMNDAMLRRHADAQDPMLDAWTRHTLASNGFGDGGDVADRATPTRRRPVLALPARRTPILAAVFAALMGALVIAARRALR
jgi:hypothetical protein